uniref:Uncharacterized protein n=1 Tax=Anguilla anguilla TaxID=7936 RepID=A0A0E9UAP2_ANGAN
MSKFCRVHRCATCICCICPCTNYHFLQAALYKHWVLTKRDSWHPAGA